MRQFSRERLRTGTAAPKHAAARTKTTAFAGKHRMSNKATISGWRIVAPKRAAVLTESAKTGSMSKSPAAA